MALGYRTVGSILAEVSLHLLEPLADTQLVADNPGTGVQTASVASMVGIYVGALLVVDTGGVNQEIVTVTATGAASFTANFANPHLAGTVILTATFPSQQPTDPIFTQSEMLGYLARAQNEFLVQVPSIFQLFVQNLAPGVIYQSTPATAIELNRVAICNPAVAITSLTRMANVVTAVTASPHGLVAGSKFLVLGTVASPLTDATFAGVFQVTAITNSTTFTYPQIAANSSSTGGVIGLWTRMYEVSQEELTLSDRSWMSEAKPVPTAFFEDRSGVYKWGVGGLPQSNFPVELLASVRGPDTLTLTDGFLLPDPVLHFIKYKTLEFAWSKDGVQANSQMAQYCKRRFDMGVVAVQRWLEAMPAARAGRMAGATGR